MGGDAQAFELGQAASREGTPGLRMRRGLPRRSRGEADGADLLRRNSRNRCARRVSACRLPVKKHLERVPRPIAQAIHAWIVEAQALEQIGGRVRRQQIDLTAQKGGAKTHGKLVAIGAQVYDVAPVGKRIGQSPDLAEKLLDADGAPAPKREYRARIEIANQRDIGHVDITPLWPRVGGPGPR